MASRKTESTGSTPYKIREERAIKNGREYRRYVVGFGKDKNGRRVRRVFTSEAKAKAAIRERMDRDKAHASKEAILKNMIGQKADRLTPDDLLDAVRGLEILKGRATIAHAADFFVKHTTPPGGEDRTVSELVEEYASSKEKANRSPYTVADIHSCMGAFAKSFPNRKVAEITTAEIEHWYEEQSGGPLRRIKRRNYLVSIFNHAVKRKYCRENPASPITMPTATKAKPYVLPVEDVERLFLYAAENVPEMIPYFALCIFAGIRPMGEMKRLDWKDIDFRRKEIFISDETSKTGDERIVAMTDNLVQWLAPHRKAEGRIFFSRAYFESVRAGASVRWEKDCMRHTFGSMHVCMWENMGATMEQMGHTNARIFKNHYRRAVRKEDAVKFWAIRPDLKNAALRFPVRQAG